MPFQNPMDGKPRLVELVVHHGQKSLSHANKPPYHLEDIRKLEICPVCQKSQSLEKEARSKRGAQALQGKIVPVEGYLELEIQGLTFTAETTIQGDTIIHEMDWSGETVKPGPQPLDSGRWTKTSKEPPAEAGGESSASPA